MDLDDKEPKPLQDILATPKNKLGWLINKAKMLTELELLIHEILDSPLNKHCKVLNYEKAVLFLATDSATWATQLRFNTKNLINQLHFYPKWSRLYKIEVKVKP